jgi:hypothetical protein
MFLIRAAFWFSIVVLLIPGDPNSGAEAPRVGAIEAITAAQGAVADLAGMCERQPEVCSSGGAALAAFGAKARYGASLIYSVFEGSHAPTPPGGTLTPDDMAPQWHAPTSIDTLIERDA